MALDLIKVFLLLVFVLKRQAHCPFLYFAKAVENDFRILKPSI